MIDLQNLIQQPVPFAIINLEEMKREGKILDYGIVDGDTVWVKPVPAVPMIDRIVFEDGRILNRNTDYQVTDDATLHINPTTDLQRPV